jgi:hypothetical protein
VSLVALVLLWAQPKHGKHQYLRILLLFEAVSLTVLALYSDVSYIMSWGLTHKRLWGLTLVLWLWGLFFIALLPRKNAHWYHIRVTLVVLFTGSLLVLVNFLNFDYLIAHATTLTTHQGTDYRYLSGLRQKLLSYPSNLDFLILISRKILLLMYEKTIIREHTVLFFWLND